MTHFLYSFCPVSSISCEIFQNLPPGALKLWPAVAPMWLRFYVANVSIWNSRHFPFLLLTEDNTISKVNHLFCLSCYGRGRRGGSVGDGGDQDSIQKQPPKYPGISYSFQMHLLIRDSLLTFLKNTKDNK